MPEEATVSSSRMCKCKERSAARHCNWAGIGFRKYVLSIFVARELELYYQARSYVLQLGARMGPSVA